MVRRRVSRDLRPCRGDSASKSGDIQAWRSAAVLITGHIPSQEHAAVEVASSRGKDQGFLFIRVQMCSVLNDAALNVRQKAFSEWHEKPSIY